jgi:hypothetical protein
VTCTVKKVRTKVKVACTVKLGAAGQAAIHWRLSRAARTYARGVAFARHGQASVRIPGVNRLPRGRYVLHLAGRHGVTLVVDGLGARRAGVT